MALEWDDHTPDYKREELNTNEAPKRHSSGHALCIFARVFMDDVAVFTFIDRMSGT
jgi:hypothetical protein